jgi:hypothetical protein
MLSFFTSPTISALKPSNQQGSRGKMRMPFCLQRASSLAEIIIEFHVQIILGWDFLERGGAGAGFMSDLT